jgi:adenine-specific DNA-methyltransferase
MVDAAAMEAGEDPEYLSRQLITYLGNKRALLDFIGLGLEAAKRRLSKSRLSAFDVFSGSGIVSRYLKAHASLLIANDLERYAEVANSCYLSNRSELDLPALREAHSSIIAGLARGPLVPGFISSLYAPADDRDIKAGERAFYTSRNAAFLDAARRLISTLPEARRKFFLAPLISEASIHANTSGVFKGFHKDAGTGLGSFGGRKGDALARIKGDIGLPFPVFSRFECETVVMRDEASAAAAKAPEVDLAYLDPPYNQHPYGSNYFMLNLIADYEVPSDLSPVSGIPAAWNRSAYNRRREASSALASLANSIKAKFLLVSFNSEGFIPFAEMLALLERIGKVETLETDYAAFRGSRNLRSRNLRVKEFLFLVEKF